MNDAKDELIIGKAPTKLAIDSSRIFEDLKLNQYHIERDLDNDGTIDRKDDTHFSHQFRVPQVQTIGFALPDLVGYSGLVYQLSFRVQQNEVPICTLTAEQNGTKPTSFAITASFDDTQTPITSYLYKIKDLSTNKVSTLNTTSKASLLHEFAKKGEYVILLEYATDEGKM